MIPKIEETEDEMSSRRLLEEVQRTFIHLDEGSRGRCFDPRSLVEASRCLELEFNTMEAYSYSMPNAILKKKLLLTNSDNGMDCYYLLRWKMRKRKRRRVMKVLVLLFILLLAQYYRHHYDDKICIEI